MEPISVFPLSELGPDALFEPMTADDFYKSLSSKKTGIKALLLDQTCPLRLSIIMDATIEEASKAVAGLSVGNSTSQPEAGAPSKKLLPCRALMYRSPWQLMMMTWIRRTYYEQKVIIIKAFFYDLHGDGAKVQFNDRCKVCILSICSSFLIFADWHGLLPHC